MNDIVEYFGFDLGDGETAVAWLRADAPSDAMMLEVGGRKNILTALGEREDGEPLIGEAACLADPNRLYLRFKSEFLTDRASSAPKIEAFARRVVEELRKNGRPEDPDRAAFYVGCPSGWGESARSAYRSLFVSAGCRHVTMIPESRAAFLFVRDSGELGTSGRALNRPTLIIDAGSSTTDFTFVDRLRAQRVFDFGETQLGGGLIDRALWEINLGRHPHAAAIREILLACPQYAARCELEARKVKEMYFSRLLQGGQSAIPCESSVKIYYRKPYETVDISCDEEDMHRILHTPLAGCGGKSFLEAYAERLDQTKKTLEGTEPETILLTGGASRMNFIGDIAREAFPDAVIVRGAEPEFSIARGLCYAARVDFRTALFESRIRELIDSDRIEGLVLSRLEDLYAAIAPLIAQELTEQAAPDAFRAWKSGQIESIEEMSRLLAAEIGRSMESGSLKEAMARPVRGWLEEIRPQIEEMTDPICEACALPPATLHMPDFQLPEGGQLNIDAGSMVDLKALSTAVDIIVATIIASLLGGSGIALVMAGPIGWIASFVAGFIASYAGTSLAQKRMRSISLPTFVRRLFPEPLFRRRISARQGELTAGILAQLTRGIDPPDDATRGTVRAISRAVEEQLERIADQVRLLIR